MLQVIRFGRSRGIDSLCWVLSRRLCVTPVIRTWVGQVRLTADMRVHVLVRPMCDSAEWVEAATTPPARYPCLEHHDDSDTLNDS
ncbi:hypothetical protein FOMPIDRAFT_1059180, partial [Fomitopsis schrenkii]